MLIYCDGCHTELKEQGALLFTPMKYGSPNVEKRHYCRACDKLVQQDYSEAFIAGCLPNHAYYVDPPTAEGKTRIRYLELVYARMLQNFLRHDDMVEPPDGMAEDGDPPAETAKE